MNDLPTTDEVVTVALGSNLGDRPSHLAAGLRGLSSTPGTTLIRLSRVFETEPVGPPGQGPYLNAVVQLVTELAPEPLLARMQEIEDADGRERNTERWGPRTLDLDLLLFGDRRIRDTGLTVPHPGLAERLFVLAPLCDLAAEQCHPDLGKTFSELALALGSEPGVRPWDAGAWRLAEEFGLRD